MIKYVFIGVILIIFSILFTIYQKIAYSDGKLHVVFCDVGQGDAIFIRTPTGKTMLIDGGPDDAVLNCLGSHMPFWGKTISLVVLTHPHSDHITGLLGVLRATQVLHFVTEDLSNDTAGYKALQQAVKDEGKAWQIIDSKDAITSSDGVRLKIVGPSSDFLKNTSPNGKIGESKEFASVEVLLSYGPKFHALFTGDSQYQEIEESLSHNQIPQLSVLQVPHHGSATGLSENLLQHLQPDIAVISVGKNNKYHHPSPLTLSLVKRFVKQILRTDQNGEVEIITDGKTWQVNTN